MLELEAKEKKRQETYIELQRLAKLEEDKAKTLREERRRKEAAELAERERIKKEKAAAMEELAKARR